MIALPDPDQQIDFATALLTLRTTHLQSGLLETVQNLNVPEIDAELAVFASADGLSRLAARGLRGEMMFPVPIVLKSNPRLLSYYRLLLGYSQKEFYKTGSGLGVFRRMEIGGPLNPAMLSKLDELCSALSGAASLLVAGLPNGSLSAALIDDLSLLTLGPQLRGGANVKKGAAGIHIVFNAISRVVEHATTAAVPTRISVTNAADRKVTIRFAADPDIVIVEEMAATENLKVAIEVKAGSDFSNIHNRLGEAEKSHIKARQAGFVECWTVVNVDAINLAMAKRESPSTNRFYRLSDIVSAKGAAYEDFTERVLSLTGVAAKPQPD